MTRSALRLLLAVHRWYRRGQLTVAPEWVCSRMESAADAAQPMLGLLGHSSGETNALPLYRLAIAVLQIQEDFRAWMDNDMFRRQADGSPAPRFWNAMALICDRYESVVGTSLIAQRMRVEFLLRRGSAKVHVKVGTNRQRERDIKSQVIEMMSNGTQNAAEITRQLRAAGVNVPLNQVVAIVGHHRRQSAV